MLVYLLITPLIVMLLARRWSWIDKVSPMTVLYIIGLLVANFLPLGASALSTNTTVGNLAVPLAIPLMLMGCNLSRWSTGTAVKAFFSGLLAVIIVVVAGFFLFRGSNDVKGFAQVSAVCAGLYTGGIPNGAPIKVGVGMPNETYLYLTSYDLIVTGCYLLFVIFLGKPVFRRLLGSARTAPSPVPEASESSAPQTGKLWPSLLLVVLLTLVIAGISYFISTKLSSDGEVNMTWLILLLTTLSIAASFLPPVRRQKQSFDMGLYCVYVFCLSIATSCNVREMDLLGSLNILYYLFFIIFGSLVLQILFAKILKIDGDTVLVSSIALINSPPFVPMAAAILGNKDIVVLGISIGLLGYLLGNYIGIGIFNLLIAIAGG